MTISIYTKVFKQLKAKPVKLARFLKHSKPKERSCGIGRKRCERCGRAGGHVQKYGMRLCRHCFRETATQLGFKKYS